MEPLVLYSCTFLRDLVRARRLVESVAAHNRDNIPFYMSVPGAQLATFQRGLPSGGVELIAEEAIVTANRALDAQHLYAVKGNLRQQVVKADFWRLGLAENSLVLDADCVFIRDFSRGDFLAEGTVPYTVMHEGRDLLDFAARFGPARVKEEFVADRERVMREMGRSGVVYDYGYAPFLWSRHVWSALADQFLAPRGESLLDAIVRCPSEFTWYGEALLKYKPIPLVRRGEFFRHYHYETQLWLDRRRGLTEAALASDYLGVVYQSNWETGTDQGPRKAPVSRFLRSFKRALRRVEFAMKGR